METISAEIVQRISISDDECNVQLRPTNEGIKDIISVGFDVLKTETDENIINTSKTLIYDSLTDEQKASYEL